MKTNAAGLALIKRNERLMLTAYPDPASPRAMHRLRNGRDDPSLSGDPWTIGYGHTGGVREGARITEQQAEAIFLADVARVEAQVAALTQPFYLNENEFAALVSFTFNVGAEHVRTSTLLHLLLQGSPRPVVAAEFGKWVYANGVALPGLVTRRREERELFLTPVPSAEVVA